MSSNSNRQTNPQEVDENLSASKRQTYDESDTGKALVLDPKTGMLTVETSSQAERHWAQNDAIPLQKVGPWA